jgi:hypothetical protein
MTNDDLRRKKPPYVIEKKSGFYWQPKGKVAASSPPCELGKDRMQAYLKGWELYYGAKRDQDVPSAAGKAFTVSWAIAKWQDSRDFKTRSDGRPKSAATMRYYREGLAVIERRIGTRDLRVFQRTHARRWRDQLCETGKFSASAQVMKTLRAFYRFCIDEGWYKGKNPASGMKVHVPTKGAYMAWGFDRVMAFCDAAAAEGRPEVGLAVVLTYDSAQNPWDILHLQWPEQQHGVVSLYAATGPIYRDGAVDMARSKTGVDGIIPLSNWSISRLEATPAADRQGPVIVNPDTGAAYTKTNFLAWVRRIRAAAEFPADLKVGNLRHEALQEAEDGKAGAEAIQSLALHSEQGTQRFYAQRRRADEAQAARERARTLKRNENKGNKV